MYKGLRSRAPDADAVLHNWEADTSPSYMARWRFTVSTSTQHGAAPGALLSLNILTPLLHFHWISLAQGRKPTRGTTGLRQTDSKGNFPLWTSEPKKIRQPTALRALAIA